MIWDSTHLMTVIDVVMLLGTFKALQTLFRYRTTILDMNIAPPINIIVAGICVISALYLADLYTTLVMPLYMTEEAVMAAMRNLHLNWSWLVVLAGFAAIVAGLFYLVPKLFPQIAAIIESLEAEVAERKRAEEAHQKARDQLELRVEERTAGLKETNEQLMREIAERKYVGKALHESEARYQAVVEDQTEMISRHAPDGTRTFVNEAYCRFHGKSRDELIGRSAYEALAPEDLDRLKALYACLTPEQPVGEFEVSFPGPDGDTIWQRWTKRAIFDASGCPTEYQAVGRDITERKRVEEELRESEQRLRSIADNIPGTVYQRTLHRDGRMTYPYMSLGVRDMLGLDPDEIMRRAETLIDNIHPDDRELRQRAIENSARTLKPYDIEYRCFTNSSEIKWLRAVARPRRQENGDVTWDGITLDITDRKRVEEDIQKLNVDLERRVEERTAELRESEERYRTVVEDQTELICRFLPSGELTFVNEAYCRYFDGTREELLDHKFMPLIPEEDREEVEAFLASLGPENPIDTHEHRVIAPDGEIRWQQWTNRTICDGQGSIVELQAVGRDITERKQAEEALHESEERFRTMVEQAGDAMFLIEPDGSFIDVNQRTCDALGYTRAELLTLSVPEIDPVFPKQKFQELFEGLQLRAPVTVEAVHQRKDGTTYPVEIRTGLIELHGRKLLLSFARDISQRKQAEDALRAAQEELLRQERLATLGQLTATVSHELRNPLGVIRTSAFILRDGLKEKMPRALRALDRVERSVVRCDRIIDEMLDFTRISDLEPEPTALDDWLAGVIEEQLLPPGIILRQELRLPGLTVPLDPDRFRRAVINVFDNACQAMRGEGDAETQSAERILTVRTRERDGRIEVLFEDRGLGIAPDVYERIFEPLFSTKGFGVGLGLPVVKQIMEQHGGGIEIETEEGRGTTVCLWLDRNARAEHVAA